MAGRARALLNASEAAAMPLATVLVLVALAWLAPATAQTGSAVELLAPETLRANGAELRWKPFDPSSGTFESYEVHRSATPGFAPSTATRLTTIRTSSTTAFRDTTAAPGATFSYRVVANGSASNEQVVTLPTAGRARTTLQPIPAEGRTTYIEDPGDGGSECAGHGREDSLRVGAEPGSTNRAMLLFDLAGIGGDATVTSATLELYRNAAPLTSLTVDLHRVTRTWKEGTALGYCSGDGATWADTESGVPWRSRGGDHDGTVVASKAVSPLDGAGWDSFDVADAVQLWLDARAPNFGVLLKARDEGPLAGKSFTYLADDYADAARRPRLTVEYGDDSPSTGPTVGVSVAGGANGGDLGGTRVVRADASDDRRVEKVEFLVDGATIATDTTAPFEASWDTTGVADGSRRVEARATDDVGNTATDATTVSIENSTAPTTDVTSPSNVYSETIRNDDPAAYWRLGETSGTTAADASGNGRHGTYGGTYVQNVTGALTGDSDGAVSMHENGNKDGKVTAPLDGLLGAPQLSVEAWARYNDIPTNTSDYVVSRGWGRNGGWTLRIQDVVGEHRASFGVYIDGSAHFASTRLDSQWWHHIAGTYDGSRVLLYVNGLALASAPAPSGALSSSTDVVVGGDLTSGAAIDEVALYPRVLSSNEVKAHHAVGKGQRVPVAGTETVTADAADDRGVSRVEFLVDGMKVGEDRTAPYSHDWNTLDADQPAYEGAHTLTTVAYDGAGHLRSSEEVAVEVDNTNESRTPYAAELTSTPAPQAVAWDPQAATQDAHGLDVTVKNTSGTTWDASDIVMRYRWVAPEGAATGIADGPETELTGSLASGASQTVRLLVEPPALPDGVDRALYTLRVEMYRRSSGSWFSAHGSRPLEHPVLVSRALTRTALGLERYHHYVGETLGGGMNHLANVANGNSVLRMTPLSAPGRGLATVLDLTYNSLEKKSESPVGAGFSLSISGLTRFGNPIDVHPNRADEIAGRANRYVEITDGDGTPHRFVGREAADGSVYWEEPDGVHLFLYSDPQSTTRRWAFTRPDRVTFFYDADGYPTAIRDRNGNEIQFTLEDTPPGEDPGGPKKRIVAVTDAAGTGSTPAPNRSFRIDYFTKAEAKKAHVRGKIEAISDRSGSRLAFDYYEDGNLRRITQEGGARADGSTLASRSWTFTYTTSSGDGPAIATAAERRDPDPRTANQSTRVYGVIDPRGAETTFAYVTSGLDRWRLASRTDRLGHTTTFAYDTAARKTTVTAPQSRTSVYTYDTDGQVVAIRNPNAETTAVEWTGRHVTKVTEPTGRSTAFAYDANGMLTERTDQLGNRTVLTYDYVSAGPGDEAGKWKLGRTVPHWAQLRTKTDPKGAATADPDDFEWTFDNDASGNVAKVTDPEGHFASYVYNADGTVSSETDERGNATSYPAYDANGLPTQVVDAEGATTAIGYDDDGLLRWVQDPRHAGESGGDPREYRTYFDYDAFHRLERQSTPKSTREARGTLIWTGVEFDPNDNVRYEHKPHAGAGWSPDLALRDEVRYDAMDRAELVVGRDRSVDPDGERRRLVYDAAGRLKESTSPRGMHTSLADDHTTFYDYDPLDRVVRETVHELDGAAIARSRRTHYCYDLAGDLRSVTAPRADLGSVTCGDDGAPAGTPHTRRMTYDAAHKPLSEADPAGRTRSRTYDANGNVETETNERGAVVERKYDERNLLTRVIEQLEAGPTGRRATTAFEYDPAGNLEREISPRGWDASSDKSTFSDYVTKYVYDRVNRLVRTELPTGPGHTTQQYVHRGYDASGNVTAISVGVEQLDPGSGPTLSGIPADKKTTVEHYDTGWVLRSNDPGSAPVRFDYTAEGWQASRAPERDGAIDAESELTWDYFVDGMLRSQSGRDRQVTTFDYDAGNRLISARDASGASDEANRIELEATWDTIDQPTKVRHRRGGATNWTATTMAYDLNGNVERRVDDLVEQPDGSSVEPGRSHDFTFDGSDRLREHLDGGESASADDDRRIVSDYLDTGWESQRTIERRAGTGWDTRQTSMWDYFENGLPKSLETRNGSGTVVESHALSYLDADGRYANGHRTKDTFLLKGSKSDAPCRSAECTSVYTYDPRDRLVKEVRTNPDGSTKTTTFELDAAGNVRREERPDGTTIVSTHRGQQLDEQTITAPGGAASLTQRYRYDREGNLDCVTTTALSECPTSDGHVSGLLSDYRYDLLNRLIALRSWSEGGTKDDEARYVYDALDRVVEQTDSHGAANLPEDGGATDPRTTLFSYLGISRNVSEEERRDGSQPSGTLLHTKSYSYDARGRRIGMTREKAGSTQPQDFTYAEDAQGSVRLLLDEAGEAKAQYGYRAYGERDDDLTDERDPDDPTQAANQADPLNAYRYTGKRLDAGSGTIDMGARRFGPRMPAFLQEDRYDGALSNLDLASDPLTQNRYSLAGGNPISFVETDGHEPASSYTDQRSVNYYYSRTRAPRRKYSRYSTPDAIDRNYRATYQRRIDRAHVGGAVQRAQRQVAQARRDDGGALGGLQAAASEAWDAVTDPKQTAEGLLHAVTHPKETVEAIVNSCDGHSAGYCIAYVGAQVVSTKGAGSALRAARAGGRGPRGGGGGDDTEIVFRYGSRAEADATRDTGQVRGGRPGTHYATDDRYGSASEAQRNLALERLPDVEMMLRVPRGAFGPPSRVRPAYGQPGGGTERTACGPVPAQLCGVRELER